MNAHNIRFNDEIRKKPNISQNICFLEITEEFLRDSKSSNKSKRAIGVRVIEV